MSYTCFGHWKQNCWAGAFGLWWESQKPGLCWATSSCHWPRAVCHFCWGRCLLWVALFPGEISKQTQIWGSFYPVFLRHFFARCQALEDCFFLGSSTSCQSPACLLPSWHLLLTEPWHVLAFDESEDTKSTGASFFHFCSKVGSEVREMKRIQPPKRKSI